MDPFESKSGFYLAPKYDAQMLFTVHPHPIFINSSLSRPGEFRLNKSDG